MDSLTALFIALLQRLSRTLNLNRLASIIIPKKHQSNDDRDVGASSPSPQRKIHPLESQNLDTAFLTAKYDSERLKRLRPDGVTQFRQVERLLSRFKEDVWASHSARSPVTNVETKVLIVGAGFGGLVTAVRLKEQGIEDFLLVEKGAGFGGTWYWNQYPGKNMFG